MFSYVMRNELKINLLMFNFFSSLLKKQGSNLIDKKVKE
jgi:hypothetical protein